MDDMQLLQQYAQAGSQDAFERLVTRHIDWVYSVCLRGVKDRHLAEDVTQAVFIILARKSKSLAPNTILRGWLFKAARFAVADALKKQNRHKRHVQRAAEMGAGELSAQETAAFSSLAPALEEAVACLGEKDRQAIMLRFYESKSLAEVGTILGISEEAAKKRVSRAVEKLRTILTREGVTVSAALLLLFLSNRATEAAPLGLGMTISGVATGSSVASGMASAIAKGTSRQMLHATGRLLAALAACAVLLAIASVLTASLIERAVQREVRQVVQISRPRPMTAWVDSSRLDQFEHIWVGAKEKILWQFHRSGDGSDHDVAGTVRDDISVARLYAVAVDRDGITWVKKLNRDLFTVPESADPQMFKQGETLPITCSDDLLALLLDDFKSNIARGGKLIELPGPVGSSERRQALGAAELNTPAIDLLGDHQWHQLTPQLRQDGSLAEDLPNMRIEINNFDAMPFNTQSDPRFVHMVPEPAGMAMLLLGAALLMKRRRNKN
jgi:RNA polymerase sigma factor (sigma-70 family)